MFLKTFKDCQGTDFVSWRDDGTFSNESFKDICSGKRILFCSLPKTHNFIDHGYVKYIRSLRPSVDQIYLVTASSKYTLFTIGTYWKDIPALYDQDLGFTLALAKHAGRNLDNSQLRNSWKYQALFDDGQLVHFTDYHVTDTRQWVLQRLKEDEEWRKILLEGDPGQLNTLKLLTKKSEYTPDMSVMCLVHSKIAPRLLFDKLWPNRDLEKTLTSYINKSL